MGVEYQPELVDELEQAIEDCISHQDNKLIFTGHRGCGKSTLLAEVGFRLTETGRYFVVMFSIADTIEESAVDHVNILFSIALQLLESAEQRQVKLKPGTKRELYRWLGEHTQTESKAVETEIETSGEATLKGGIPTLLEFLAKIKSKLKLNSVIRQEISTKFGRRISDLIAQINEVQAYVENATGQKVLVIIDDLDKLDLGVTETIFSKNIQPLLAPHCRIIYTVPIATLREVTIKGTIEGFIQKIHMMRVTCFFDRTTVRSRDRVPNPERMQIFSDILDRRLPSNLIEPGIKEQIILSSGGVLRELIRIADLCRNQCMQKLRRQIRTASLDTPSLKLNQAILEQVLTDLQINFDTSLGQNDYKLLKFIYEKFEPEDIKNQRFLELLHGLYVLEYRDKQVRWYDLNPLVLEMLMHKGVFHDSN